MLLQKTCILKKEAVQNEEIEMLRTSAVNSLLERNDTIIVASVASIYGLGDPKEYTKLAFNIVRGEKINRNELFRKLVEAQYSRNDFDLKPGTFRVKGDVIEIMPPITSDYVIQLDTFDDVIETIREVDALTAKGSKTFETYPIFPAYTHASTRDRIQKAVPLIFKDLIARLTEFTDEGKLLEAERLEFRTKQDIDSLQEVWNVSLGLKIIHVILMGEKPGRDRTA